MAKKARSRTILVRLLSQAGTGYFYTFRRPRLADKLSMMKFDPKVGRHVLFAENKPPSV
ncbi:50S ribosomal protein L33 [Ramicandelaber brevisporus]|nr:50S ribosomal protein L33 [Ramicandelaber brevisporus]